MALHSSGSKGILPWKFFFDFYMLRDQFWCTLEAQILEQCILLPLYSTILDYRDSWEQKSSICSNNIIIIVRRSGGGGLSQPLLQ